MNFIIRSNEILMAGTRLVKKSSKKRKRGYTYNDSG